MVTFAEPILHVDMDAFFVEVERRRNPELRGLPVVVGGGGARGVVASASYEARRFGVHSAMPMVEARRRCVDLVVVSANHHQYGEVSNDVFAVFRTFTPLVEGLSVDEAFLDVGGLRRHYATSSDVAQAIRRRIRAKLELPSSVGVASNKFLAKLASEEAKPDGVFLVAAGRELDFLHPLPVERLWGVGAATLAGLEAMGIATVGELATTPAAVVERRLGRTLGRHLVALAAAKDSRPVETNVGAKSVSVESTFEHDLTEYDAIETALLRRCDQLASRLRRQRLTGRTVSIKVRFEDFSTLTRSVTVRDPVAHRPDLFEASLELLRKVDLAGRGVRLLGVGVSGLVEATAPRQLSMTNPNRRAASVAVEEVRGRFGDDALLPARLINPPRTGG